MILRAVCAALVLVFVTACWAEEPKPRPSVETCEENGGTLVNGLVGPICTMPEPDAGAACRDSSECSGVCLADTRTCSPLRPMVGCFSYLDQGETFEICVD